jgi:hypothetical protein
MKNSRFTLMIVIFISGITLGFIVPRLFPIINTISLTLPKGVEEISVAKANDLFLRYLKTATIQQKPFKGFMIKKEQLEVLNHLFKRDPSLSGFRVYMAEDSLTYERRILVGCRTKAGKEIDDTTIILKTIYGGADPCPPICDVDSPITRELP